MSQIGLGKSVITGKSGGSSASLLDFTSMMTNAKMILGYASITANTNTDIYTVPAGKRVAFGAWRNWSTAAGTINVQPQIKISSTYYPLGTAVSCGTSAVGSNSVINPFYVAEAGEIISFNSASKSGTVAVNLWYTLVQFDNTSSLATSKLTSLSSGDNTLYTVTSGKTAFISGHFNQIGTAPAFNPMSTPTIGYWNNSGNTRNINLYQMASGGGASSAAFRTNANSAATNAATTAFIGCGGTMASQDFMIINTDANTATQFAWITHVEV